MDGFYTCSSLLLDLYLAWEPPYAAGVALKRQKTKKIKKRIRLQRLRLAAEVADSIPSPAEWVKVSGIAAAAARIQSLACRDPYAAGAAIKIK